MIHELFEELNAFDPKWPDHYLTIGEAAQYAGLTDLYRDWAQTTEGREHIELFAVPDILSAVEEAQRDADIERELYNADEAYNDYLDELDDDWGFR